MSRLRLISIALLLLLMYPALESSAYYRITQGAVSLVWNSLPVRYLLQSDGSADIADDSEFLACRQAFQTWQDVAGCAIVFEEDTTSDASRTDFSASDIHLIWFDETDASGFFPGASGTIAITPITYNSSLGIILDADIIFNSNDHAFSTDKTSGTFDVQSIAAHEIGHFLGLDHSTSACSTMFPFAETRRTTARSLSADDEGGASAIYPIGAATGSIGGFILRASNTTAVPGANVVAVNDDGVVVTTTLGATNGSFTLAQLPADTYVVYAEPLDGPVLSGNFSSSIASSVATDFSLMFFGGNQTPTSIPLSAGQAVNIGVISVGGTALQNLKYATDFPYTIVRGTTPSVLILGDEIQAADSVTISGTDVTVTGKWFVSFGSLRGFTIGLSVPPNAILGPRDIYTTTAGGTVTVITGIVEVSNAAPTISTIAPSFGWIAGGDSLSVTGTGFTSGATLAIGDSLAIGTAVLSSTQITATAPAASPGAKHVIVQNPDGQVAILSNGFDYFAYPSILGVFPAAGSTLGGTSITIFGSDFASGLTVEIGGVAATVQSVAATTVDCVTPPGVLGDADVVLTNPGGYSDTLAVGFTYVSGPDPVLGAISPSSGGSAGGTFVTITGSNFVSGSRVIFGQDADGGGGAASSSVVFVSSTEITAISPAYSTGTVAVTVENPSGASSRLDGAFTYFLSAGGGGSGGGGCLSMAPPRSDPPDAAAIWGAMLPYLFFTLLVCLRRTTRAHGWRTFSI